MYYGLMKVLPFVFLFSVVDVLAQAGEILSEVSKPTSSAEGGVAVVSGRDMPISSSKGPMKKMKAKAKDVAVNKEKISSSDVDKIVNDVVDGSSSEDSVPSLRLEEIVSEQRITPSAKGESMVGVGVDVYNPRKKKIDEKRITYSVGAQSSSGPGGSGKGGKAKKTKKKAEKKSEKAM